MSLYVCRLYAHTTPSYVFYIWYVLFFNLYYFLMNFFPDIFDPKLVESVGTEGQLYFISWSRKLRLNAEARMCLRTTVGWHQAWDMNLNLCGSLSKSGLSWFQDWSRQLPRCWNLRDLPFPP